MTKKTAEEIFIAYEKVINGINPRWSARDLFSYLCEESASYGLCYFILANTFKVDAYSDSDIISKCNGESYYSDPPSRHPDNKKEMMKSLYSRLALLREIIAEKS